MKLNAISGGGSKKDFIDIFFLLKKYSLRDILGFYNEKYHDGSQFLVLKSLTYFDDADKQVMPVMFEDVTWPDIKKNIVQHFNDYMSNK